MRDFTLLITAHSFGKEGKEPFNILENVGITPVVKRKNQLWTEEELIEIIPGADGIIVGADLVTRKVIEKAEKLKIICKHGVGVDNIDLEAATEKGILVTTGVGSNTTAVAELTVALLLSMARNIPNSNNDIKSGKWIRCVGTELYGKTAGIIGLGRIGKEVAKNLRGLEMKVIAFEPVKDEKFAKENKIEFVDLKTLLTQSDIISLHVPLVQKTRNIINSDTIRLMKPNVFLVNTARGGLVDEEALYSALKSKRIAGAAIDTFILEPPFGSKLLELPNVIATPHIGAYTHEAINEMSCMAAKAVADFVSGKIPSFSINIEALKTNKKISMKG